MAFASPLARVRGVFGAPFASLAVAIGAWTLASLAPADIKFQAAVGGQRLIGDESAVEVGAETFQLPPAGKETKEAFEDYHRHVGKKAWDRAFAAIQKFRDSKSEEFITGADGVYLTAQRRLQRELHELPPEGREAYRLFYDPEAKRLWERSRGADDLATLERLYSLYFPTSVGDLAADRLGDAYFEMGHFDQSADCYRSILDDRPDSALPRVQLWTKFALASLRNGRVGDFDEAQRIVATQHAGEKIVIGGESVVAADYLKSLQIDRPRTPTAPTREEQTPLALPTVEKPAWKFAYQELMKLGAQPQVRQQWLSMPLAYLEPPAVADDERVYVNLIGNAFAIDLKTGRMAWRVQAFHDLASRANDAYRLFPEQHAIALGEGALWVVARDWKQPNSQAGFQLWKLDPATGKVLWSSGTGPFSGWNFVGVPVFDRGRVYIGAFESNKPTEQLVVALSAANGSKIWSTNVGLHKTDPNQPNSRALQPRLLLADDALYVDTNAGAIVRLSSTVGTLQWGVTYRTDPVQPNYWNYEEMLRANYAGGPMIAGGTLFVKSIKSDRMCAIDVAQPRLRWTRPADKDSFLIGVDADCVYVGGDELCAYERTTRALRWANRLPGGCHPEGVRLIGDRIIASSSRGLVEIDAKNGDAIQRFRGADLDARPGALLATPQRWVTVSSDAITAYPRGAPATETTAKSESQGREGR